MALPSFCTDEVTVWRAPYKDARGTQVRDWANATPTTVAGCNVQPVSSASDWRDPAQAVTVRLVLRMPPGSDVEPGDKIVYGDASYAIEGAPHAWRSPSGRVSHVECRLVDWRS